jgi:hypothetical protein
MVRVIVDGAEGAFLHIELAQNHGTLGSEPAHDLRIV